MNNGSIHKNRILAVFILTVFISSVVCGCRFRGINRDGNRNENRAVNGNVNRGESIAENIASEVKSDNSAASTMQVHFIDVGQGDCSLIICDNEAMLIDAGDNDKGTLVQKYLNEQGITGLKYVVGTHPDADHIGGLDVIIYKFPCENILMSDVKSDTKSFADVMSAINSKGYKVTTVGQGDSFDLGSASFEVLSPLKGHPYEDDNNNSVILKLNHGNNSFLFMGDAEYQPQQVIVYDDEIDGKADVIKVSHHGADSGYMKAFYDEVNPEYAVISVGNNNDYGHPHSKILNDFKDRGVKVFRTDEQGTVVARSDGNSVSFNVSPSTTWAAGVPAEGSNTVTSDSRFPHNVSEKPTEDVTYVVNTNSRKFHSPTCEFVTDMQPKNRIDLTCTRDELLILYPDAAPCGICRP